MDASEGGRSAGLQVGEVVLGDDR